MRISFGSGTTFRRGFSLMLDKKAHVIIGENCFFNNYCSINAINRITIGKDTIFGESVKIYDHNHQYRDMHVLIKNQGYSSASVTIGQNCWLGSNVIVLKGVTIGDNCIIGAGCIIYKNVPNNTIVMCKQKVFSEEYYI